MVNFKFGLSGKGRVNSVILDIITEINYSCYYMHFFLNTSTM